MPAQGKADDIQKTFAHKLGGDTDAGKKKLLLQKVTSYAIGYSIVKEAGLISWVFFFFFFYQKESYMIWGAS